jgi:hypothetical protein
MKWQRAARFQSNEPQMMGPTNILWYPASDEDLNGIFLAHWEVAVGPGPARKMLS